jgi:hypothetical protein
MKQCIFTRSQFQMSFQKRTSLLESRSAIGDLTSKSYESFTILSEVYRRPALRSKHLSDNAGSVPRLSCVILGLIYSDTKQYLAMHHRTSSRKTDAHIPQVFTHDGKRQGLKCDAWTTNRSRRTYYSVACPLCEHGFTRSSYHSFAGQCLQSGAI